MALPVRPQVWPPAQTDIRPGRNDTRAAAQKAFFDAAMGRAPGGAQAAAQSSAAQTSADPAPQQPTTSAAQAVKTVAATEARATDRLPPPGSIINILV